MISDSEEGESVKKSLTMRVLSSNDTLAACELLVDVVLHKVWDRHAQVRDEMAVVDHLYAAAMAMSKGQKAQKGSAADPVQKLMKSHESLQRLSVVFKVKADLEALLSMRATHVLGLLADCIDMINTVRRKPPKWLTMHLHTEKAMQRLDDVQAVSPAYVSSRARLNWGSG